MNTHSKTPPNNITGRLTARRLMLITVGALRTTPLPLYSWVAWIWALLGLLAPPVTTQAQFTYQFQNGAITITGYTGPGGSVCIPDTIDGLPVGIIGEDAFSGCVSLTSVVIPDSVTSIAGHAPILGPTGAFYACSNLTTVILGNSITNIGYGAFGECSRLTSIVIPPSARTIGIHAFSHCRNLTNLVIGNGLVTIADSAFSYCASLTSVVIPDSVTSIGEGPATWNSVFQACSNLTSLTLGNGLTNIGSRAFRDCVSLTRVVIPKGITKLYAFENCTSLRQICFEGNAPQVDGTPFQADTGIIAFYLPGTSGWGATFAGVPTALWLPQMSTGDATFGLRTNRFGFNVTWARGRTVVIEACSDLASPHWISLQTNLLSTGSFYFADPDWSNFPARLYRIRRQY